MKFTAMLLLATGIAFAQDAPPVAAKTTPAQKVETVEDLKKQLTEKDSEINWLNQVVQQLNAKMDAMMKYYGANDTLQQLEKFNPKNVKPPIPPPVEANK